jgi:hypothetical protein
MMRRIQARDSCAQALDRAQLNRAVVQPASTLCFFVTIICWWMQIAMLG